MLPQIVSYGGGVQSSTMLLLAAHGLIEPMPRAAIMADTGDEPQAVTDYVEWIRGVVPFEVRVVRRMFGLAETLHRHAELMANESVAGFVGQLANPPLFTLDAAGGRGQLRRQCTQTFKIDVVEREIVRLMGWDSRPKEVSVEQWIGISTDEAQRMKPIRNGFSRARFPLIELRMSRGDCLAWIERHGYPQPPKSACWHCPYRSDAGWMEMRRSDPDSWRKAVELDNALAGGLRGVDGRVFLHSSRQRLQDVDFGDGDRQQDLLVDGCVSGDCWV